MKTMCPFGGLMAESTEAKEQQFKYNGKEFEPMPGINLYDYVARQYAKQNYKALTKGMKPGIDKFNFVSHSMGGAYAEGMIRYMSEQGWETENAVFLNAWEPTEIKNKEEHNRIDATCSNAPIQYISKPLLSEPDIPSSDDKIRIKSKESLIYIYRDLIDGNSKTLWNIIKELLKK